MIALSGHPVYLLVYIDGTAVILNNKHKHPILEKDLELESFSKEDLFPLPVLQAVHVPKGKGEQLFFLTKKEVFFLQFKHNDAFTEAIMSGKSRLHIDYPDLNLVDMLYFGSGSLNGIYILEQSRLLMLDVSQLKTTEILCGSRHSSEYTSFCGRFSQTNGSIILYIGDLSGKCHVFSCLT